MFLKTLLKTFWIMNIYSVKLKNIPFGRYFHFIVNTSKKVIYKNKCETTNANIIAIPVLNVTTGLKTLIYLTFYLIITFQKLFGTVLFICFVDIHF